MDEGGQVRLSRREWLGCACGAAAGLVAFGAPSTRDAALASSPGAPAGDAPSRDGPPPHRPTRDEVEAVLWRQVLAAWYPRAIEPAGGFHERFAEDWTPLDDPSKFLVHQARQTWTAAAVALRYPDRREAYLGHARHGLRFLVERMQDRRYGGFFDTVLPDGRPDPRAAPWKNLYAQAFGIYAAATAHRATGEPAALELARQGFDFLERAMHDAESGGYFEHATFDGTPVLRLDPGRPAAPGVIGNIGQKSMNAHIHTLEALTALRQAWADPLVARRLGEVFRIVRDRIVADRGHLVMFAAPDWRPLDQRNSFGHQLETAFLLVEAQEVLGIDDPAERERTRETALRLVDHSLRFGDDPEHGGFFDEGPPEQPATRRHKIWWVQAEALNGLLTAEALVDRQRSDRLRPYQDAFARTWRFFREKTIDARYGDCFEATDEAGNPLPHRRAKGSPWKASYHVARALMVAAEQLEA